MAAKALCFIDKVNSSPCLLFNALTALFFDFK
jgi:hypothetical protein